MLWRTRRNLKVLAREAMSILTFRYASTSIAVGFRVDASAKKDQSRRKQRTSSISTRRNSGTGSEQVKKEGLVPDGVVEPARPNLRAANQVVAGDDAALDQKDAPGETNGKWVLVADRVAVLKACVGTSVGLSLAAFLLRQVFHSGAEGGWLNVVDIAALMPFGSELWHVIPTVGVAALVTSLRQVLLQVWPEFSVSTEVANKQVLTSLEAVDIFAVACLSGISEEFLFRGALLPLLGPDWKGALGAGLIFGVLHVSGGRNSSFALWASFVGVLYGILGLYTSDLAAPMAAHSLANLLGAAIWKVSQNDEETKSS